MPFVIDVGDKPFMLTTLSATAEKQQLSIVTLLAADKSNIAVGFKLQTDWVCSVPKVIDDGKLHFLNSI